VKREVLKTADVTAFDIEVKARHLLVRNLFLKAMLREDAVAEPIRREQPRIGRNDPCPCGSGEKYKNCCGIQRIASRVTRVSFRG
jgi:uncharacterized protein YecA (UPF0149 family)